MSFEPLLRLLALGLLSAALSCADGGAPSPQARDVQLGVWNLGTHAVKELFVHDGPAYAGALSQIAQPLEPFDRTQVPFHTGQYVTVIREKNNGQDLALSTTEGLLLYNSQCTLVVLNEELQLQGSPLDVDDSAPAGGDPTPGD